MRTEIALTVGSRDSLPGWILIEKDTIFVQIGADATVLCLAQSPTLATTLIDHPAPVALHVKIIAQRLSKLCPGKQVFVSTDQVEEESNLFWADVGRQLKDKIEEIKMEDTVAHLSIID